MPASPFTSRIAGLVERVNVHTRQQIIDITLARTAANEAAIRAALGHEAPFERFVDGQQGKPLAQVNEHGYTLTRFDLMENVVDEVIRALIEASPFGPAEHGHYRDDHWLFVNGQRRDANEGAAVRIGPGDEIVIINVRPYARKIEGRNGRGRGTTTRRPGLSVQAPNGVYEITARAMQARFGNVATILFAYHALMGGGASLGGKTRDGRYPALEITAKG